MSIYLTIITTILVVTQIIRVLQNRIQLRRQNILFDAQLKSVEDITQEDLDTQRKAYRMMVKYYESKLPQEQNYEEDT